MILRVATRRSSTGRSMSSVWFMNSSFSAVEERGGVVDDARREDPVALVEARACRAGAGPTRRSSPAARAGA